MYYGTKQINFRGQAQERIVVLTDTAVLTFAYDFKSRKVDESRVHRHIHEHFKHISFGTLDHCSLGMGRYNLRDVSRAVHQCHRTSKRLLPEI